jgi:hypothetical protein
VKNRYFFSVIFFTFLCFPGSLTAIENRATTSTQPELNVTPDSITLTVNTTSATLTESRPVRGIHLTASAAGSKKYRKNHLEPMFANTLINAVVIDLKEEDGFVYVPGIKLVEKVGAYSADIPDLQAWLADLKNRNIYTVGRIVVFKDNKAPRKYPALSVHNPNGEIWRDRKHITWLDPYNREAWRYNLVIALQAAKLGFDEIQFDYLRFPTDGNLKTMRFIKPYHAESASQALVDFLRQAHQVLHPLGTKISIDVFGLTTSVNTGMGIGQRLAPMAEQVDFVCPMTYPSHYARGEYGIPNPNDQPYRVIHLAMRDALRVLGPENARKLRPYLQDFSLKGRGIHYGPKEVRAQIQATTDLGVSNWTLWNARCVYTTSAFRTPVSPSREPSEAPAPSPASSTVKHPKKH